MQTGVPYHTPVPFNETGAFIWKAYAEGSDEEQIAEKLGKMFAMEKEEMLPDVREFLKGIHRSLSQLRTFVTADIRSAAEYAGELN